MRRRLLAGPAPWVFLLLLGSSAFFWQARDWNTASRLMLVYALGDRGTIRLDGLDRQTGDIARFQNHYYSDKLPGFSFTALPAYLVGKAVLGWSPHPVGAQGFAYWWPDYPTTLAVSGAATALLGALLAIHARRLGCGPRRAALVGIAFGLATPAYVYSTLAYGHPLTGLALVGAFLLVARHEPGRSQGTSVAAGFLAAFAATVELQVAPVSLLIGLLLLGKVAARLRPFGDLLGFAAGAIPPTAALLFYNAAAFGSPFDMGYFHHATARFAEVHSRSNPLGLQPLAWDKAVPLLIGPYRGLFFYAPILILAVPGWGVLLRRREWGLALGSFGACLAAFLVNLSYPEWSGGWSTGPRLLLTAIPFAMIPVAAVLGTGSRVALAVALLLAFAGGALMLLFQGVGGRLPDSLGGVPLDDPLRQVVWPLWRGDPLPGWWIGERYTRTLAGLAWDAEVARLPAGARGVQFAPLLVFQAGMLAAILAMFRPPASGRRPAAPVADGAPATPARG